MHSTVWYRQVNYIYLFVYKDILLSFLLFEVIQTWILFFHRKVQYYLF